MFYVPGNKDGSAFYLLLYAQAMAYSTVVQIHPGDWGVLFWPLLFQRPRRNRSVSLSPKIKDIVSCLSQPGTAASMRFNSAIKIPARWNLAAEDFKYRSIRPSSGRPRSLWGEAEGWCYGAFLQVGTSPGITVVGLGVATSATVVRFWCKCWRTESRTRFPSERCFLSVNLLPFMTAFPTRRF